MDRELPITVSFSLSLIPLIFVGWIALPRFCTHSDCDTAGMKYADLIEQNYDVSTELFTDIKTAKQKMDVACHIAAPIKAIKAANVFN